MRATLTLNGLMKQIWVTWRLLYTAQKMRFSIMEFFSKCDQIRWKLRIWSHLLKKSFMENFIFCSVISISPWTITKSNGCNKAFSQYHRLFISGENCVLKPNHNVAILANILEIVQSYPTVRYMFRDIKKLVGCVFFKLENKNIYFIK